MQIMFWKVLFIKLLLLHYATQSEPEIYANCYEDFLVMCSGVDSMDFISVAWYKFNNTRHGIIRRARDNKTVRYDKFNRSPKPRFGEKHSLLIPSVTPEDSGTYICDISADLGGQNKEFKVNLTVNDCVNSTDMATMITGLNTTQVYLPCHQQEDVPVKWSVIGYMAVGLSKIILSLICIWVLQAIRMRSSRRRQHKW